MSAAGGPELAGAGTPPQPGAGGLASACQILAEAAILELRGLAVAVIDDAAAATRQLVQDGAAAHVPAPPTRCQAVLLGTAIGAVVATCLIARGAHARP